MARSPLLFLAGEWNTWPISLSPSDIINYERHILVLERKQMVITCFGEKLKGSLPGLRLFSDFFC